MRYSDSYDPLEGVAIIGMAGRFPGARTVAELWDNLVGGRECISHFAAEELEAAHPEDMEARSKPSYVRARGVLDDVEMFDERFFGFNPREAEILDPQQRLFLQAAWEALEHAGHDPRRFSGPIGVFAGATTNSYFLQNLLSRRDVTDLVGPLLTLMGNNNDYVATRVAYKLDLHGPALNIQNACSTSLVAVCTAVQSLLSYQCDMALAGGVSIQVPQRRGYLYEKGSILSPDGHCRAFDEAAAGTVFSNGLGIVVLRRLREALEEGDTIYAVIKGAALNNDGSSKVSFTAPSVDGHSRVISMAQALGGIDPATISYIEAHGTGTTLGDPIEIAGLTQAFRAGGAMANGFCAIGSIKTNIGHLDVAAGVAGLIKTALALHRKTLPASLNFRKPNPKLSIESTPFFVNATRREWIRGATPRRAGVSSFGVGGTNAHVVLEEALDSPAVRPPSRAKQLLLLSARDAEGLERMTEQLRTHLLENPAIELADVAYTLQVGRRRFEHCRSLVCSDGQDAIEQLRARDAKRAHDLSGEAAEARVAFMFPGQGAQYVNMARGLYESEPVFRDEIDACASCLIPHLGIDLRSVLYPAADALDQAQTQITQTAITQPALFAVEYALARLWLSWGVQPSVMIGHSVGEYVAACIGGTFSRDSALTLLARRAQLMQNMPAGSMLAVRASAGDLAADLGPHACIAAFNAPTLTVVSGEHEAIASLAARMDRRGIAYRRLPTSHAFHSAMMEPVAAPFADLIRKTQRSAPHTRWISSLTGQLITDAEATDPVYWARQLREPVRFIDGIAPLLEKKFALVEVGPGQALTSLAKQQERKIPEPLIVTSLDPAQDFKRDVDHMLAAVGQLWSRGVEIDWSRFHGGLRRRIGLPTYPFRRERHWVSAGSPPDQTAANVTSVAPPAETPGIDSNQSSAMTQNHSAALIGRLQRLFADLSGIEANGLDPRTTFLELGLDSLFLTQASNAIAKHFGARITVRALLDDCSTLDALAARLATTMPIEARAEAAVSTVTSSAGPSARAESAAQLGDTNAVRAAGAVAPSFADLVAQQLAIISRQLEMLGARPETLVPRQTPSSIAAASAPVRPPAPSAKPPADKSGGSQSFGPYRPPTKGPTSGLTDQQESHLAAFIERYNRRTKLSKEFAAANRAQLADPRSVAGFRQVLKEIVYPIVTVRSSGSHLWDIDGNDYVDLTNGFGMIFFGHSPAFVLEAIEAQLGAGIEIGPQTSLAADVSKLLCEMVGMDRAAFCSTGSEAVMAAIRIARTVSGRDKIVMFSGAYHGIFDEVLVRPAQSRDGRAIPIAPGIPREMTENVIVLDYGSPDSLQTIETRAREVAAVLVEPVQSRRPELQPREFLQDLRKVTAQNEIALVFDEVVTGFRVHPGGAQAVFGVRADIATYGKVVGGGLPIGMVAGRKKYLDALDGGAWRYGDDSAPEAGVTFFAGTFVRHPLALAAARAVLLKLKDEGAELQRGLNLRTTAFVERLRKCASECGASVQINHFSSWFCIAFPLDVPLASVFFAMMREQGVHIWEGRPCFLTLAHSDSDLEKVETAFRISLTQMQRWTFLPGGTATPRTGRDALGREALFIPDPSRPGKYLQLQEAVQSNE